MLSDSLDVDCGYKPLFQSVHPGLVTAEVSYDWLEIQRQEIQRQQSWGLWGLAK